MSVRRTAARLVALPAAVVGFGALAAAPALAHVTITPDSGAAESYTVLTVSVPHGCEGSPTTKIAISIPEEINAVTPTRNALWDVEKKLVTLAEPVKDAHGNEITERVGQVVYTAKAPLPDGYRDAFELSLQVPDAVGKTLAFPVIQTCVKGETKWNETAAEGAPEPEHPAPTLTVTESTGDGHHGSASGEAEESSHGEKSSDDEGASKGLAYTGLGVGVLGLLAGAAALAKSRKA
ncbi:uncharacterized protein YcnI [Marmoricola sp. OAE513]|uniref:YcnI family copper-binding membrane protein n=1 Tax=Marmoricola sp. OAE513 TaxID=2817894 RepID=UPI001AE88A2F